MYCYIKTFLLPEVMSLMLRWHLQRLIFRPSLIEWLIPDITVAFLLYSNSFYCFTLPEEFPVEMQWGRELLHDRPIRAINYMFMTQITHTL